MQKIFIGLLLLSLTRYSNGSVQSGSKLMYCIQVIKNKINTHRLRSDLHPRCKEYGAYSHGHPSIVKSWCKDDHYKIGKFCSIADNITFYLNGNHRTDWISTYPFMSFLNDFPEAKDINGHPATKGPIIIGNDVWIGSGVTILSGVTVGDGAVLGANSVVAKNVPPYAVVAGNPARVVKLRFTPNQITRLLTIRWWDWPIERIRQNSHLLCSVNIENFLNANDGH